MTLQCPRGRAVRLGASSAGACRVVPGGGGGSLCPFIPLTPPLGAGGWVSPWRRCRPPGGAGGASHESLECRHAPAPGVRWLASCTRSGVCRGVHGTQTPFGWLWCPLLQQCLTPRCVRAHVGQGGSHAARRPRIWSAVSGFPFFLDAFRVAGGVKMGAAGLPLPPSSPMPPAGVKTPPLWSAGVCCVCVCVF